MFWGVFLWQLHVAKYFEFISLSELTSLIYIEFTISVCLVVCYVLLINVSASVALVLLLL